MNCFFLTFGCKVNTCETAGMQALLRQSGHTIVQSAAEADAVIFNSCTVTASGDSRTRNAMRKIRRSNPQAILVLTGCYVQAYPDAAAAVPEADIILGTKHRSRLPALLAAYAQRQSDFDKTIAPYTGNEPFEALPCDEMLDNTRAFLKIQDGCNCFCSYCIIPYARGRCRSMPPAEIRIAAEHFATKDYHEIILCGINLGFYGTEWNGTLAEAAEQCSGIRGLSRIRLGSLEPERLTDDVLNRLAALPEFCPQFHLSLQSGCDRTLHRMNRKYSASEYEQICKNIRQHFPDCSITTDFMVGFPGETDADFEASLRFAEQIGFAAMHVFRYSPRPGTRAAEFPEKVAEAVKTARMEQAIKIGAHAKAAFLSQQIGRTVPVLFERERNDGFHTGHAPDGTIVKVSVKNTKISLRNQIFYVIIEKSDAFCCYGSIVTTET